MNANQPLVVWIACFLWLLSIFCTVSSLLLFFCVGDMLFFTGTDLVNALVLLSGIVMLPTNFFIVHSIAKGRTIDHNSKMLCCRLWMCIVWIVIINVVGAILSIRRLYNGRESTLAYISHSIDLYKQAPKHKHFIDNLQWSLKCCGVHSYNDWFTQDWHDSLRDYEWDPLAHLRNRQSKREIVETDSVPLSCCKSGSCVSSYIKELGTSSIHTQGCGDIVCRIIMISMNFHLFLFVTVIILEVMMLKYITNTKKSSRNVNNRSYLQNLMPVRTNFNISSGSRQFDPEDSDEFEVQRHITENQ